MNPTKALALLAGLAIAAPLHAQPPRAEPTQPWVELTREVRAVGGPRSILVRRSGIERLRLESTSGQPLINEVRVQFRDGSVDTYPINHRFARPGDAFDIELKQPGRPIQRLVITTSRRNWGFYRVLAE